MSAFKYSLNERASPGSVVANASMLVADGMVVDGVGMSEEGGGKTSSGASSPRERRIPCCTASFSWRARTVALARSFAAVASCSSSYSTGTSGSSALMSCLAWPKSFKWRAAQARPLALLARIL